MASIVVLMMAIPQQSKAQGKWNPFYEYSRKIHFGFSLGTNVSTFKYKYSPEWYKQDTIHSVKLVSFPGITLGAIIDVHLGEYFDLRFVPSLVLIQRNLEFSDSNAQATVKQIESALIEFPLLLKYKSERHNNVRLYVIGGLKYSYDLSSDFKAKRNPVEPKVVIIPNNFYYEYGTGLDLYFKYFKMSPEIKFSRGINNILQPDQKIYSRIFENFRSNVVFISLNFEG